MIKGDKPSGWLTAYGSDKVIGETRQCGHCQFTWNYIPGSGNRRGYCLKCDRLVCARPECVAKYTCSTLDYEI